MAEVDEVCIRDLSLNGSGDGPDDKDGEGGGQSNGGRDRAAATAVIAEAETPDAYVAGLNASGKARISQHCFTEEALDTAVHFQVVDVGRQLYIWVAAGTTKLGNLSLAMAPGGARGSVPPSTTLIRLPEQDVWGGEQGSGEGAGTALARRLVLRVGRPVALAWNLPEAAPMLQAWAERRLLQELVTLGLANPT